MTKLSTKPYKKSLFIFRRDLRIQDNTVLIDALKQSETVVACFIFDPRQINDINKYKSLNSIQFMLESLKDLKSQLEKAEGKLFIFKGVAEEVIEMIIETLSIDAIYINKDYTPFSIKRDANIHNLCTKHDIDFNSFNDCLLSNPDIIYTKNKTRYSTFTPFFKAASKITVMEPEKNNFTNYYSNKINYEYNLQDFKTLAKTNTDIYEKGGRSECLKILSNINDFQKYNTTRNFPSIETTKLSAHNKFGTCSIREIYHTIKLELNDNNELIKQLYWRDFYTYIAFYNPYVFGKSFQHKYVSLPWENNTTLFEKWCKGLTGVPIVDAGMNQLNATGYMHNRVRLITASFLVKDLLIDWQWGEQYFAQKLVDYDPAVNNGNWQWVASTGADRQPYFRTFNPWLQQKKYDPECTYIKKWVPALKSIDTKTIHNWENSKIIIKDYPKPIVNHQAQIKKTIALYKATSNQN